MLSIPPSDSVKAAGYVENYLDCVENLPEDVQRYLSRLHELDINYRNYMRDAENYKEALQKEDLEVHVQRKTLFKLEQVLISLQEVGDEKVEIGQHILDLIDNKYRALDLELRELGATDVHKEEEGSESGGGGGGKELTGGVVGAGVSGGGRSSETVGGGGGGGGLSAGPGASSGAGGSTGTVGTGGERSKRVRRSGRTGEEPPPAALATPAPSGGPAESLATETVAAPPPPPAAAGRSSKRQATASTKKKKRKSRASNTPRDDSPLRDEEIITTVAADIDEPTYCLCDQISYGEMILCDNDLCPIEWFHFVCVSLNSKPKGKWFCPKCRGDRPNVMKPKSQFLKELERYNKEKEEKS